MKKANYKIAFLMGVCLAVLSGCSAEDQPGMLPDEETVSVNLEIDGNTNYTRAPGDAALSVNRILILPFRKTNEALANVPANFTPEVASARQLNVSLFPTVATKLNLSAASTYQLLIIGYNQSDYDFANQSNPARRFNMDFSKTLADFYLQPVNAPVVSEFFSCLATGYLGATTVGQTFKPSQVDNIKGTLNRLVSGLTLTIKSVPGYVNSMTLVAERLVTAIKASDATPLTWQTAGDSGVKTLGTATPVSGTVTFNLFMMPGTSSQNTLLYLDVAYGTGFSERYTVKLEDTSGVVSNKRITFGSNRWVKISGSYSNINLGFTLSKSVNLDDNAWDGIH